MVLISAIIRPEKMNDVKTALEEAEFFAFSKWELAGRGRQKGIQVGDFFYETMQKNMLYMAVEDEEKNQVIDIIMQNAMTGERGNAGDGRIFVSPITESYTISGQEKDS